MQDGRLKLVVLWRGKDTLTLYSIDNGARYEVPYEEAGSDATGNRNFPKALTDDGRILVTDGYIDRSGVAASRYALIDLGAYLAGSGSIPRWRCGRSEAVKCGPPVMGNL